MGADADERAYCLQVATFYPERAIASHARGRWFETSRAHMLLALTRAPDRSRGDVSLGPHEGADVGLGRCQFILGRVVRA